MKSTFSRSSCTAAAVTFIWALVIPSSVVFSQVTDDLLVTTPDAVVFCTPVTGLTITGGTPPYNITVLPDGDSTATPVEYLAIQNAAGDISWTDDIVLPGDSVGWGVEDSLGALSFSGVVLVTAGTLNSCPDANVGAATTPVGVPITIASSSSSSVLPLTSSTTSSTPVLLTTSSSSSSVTSLTSSSTSTSAPTTVPSGTGSSTSSSATLNVSKGPNQFAAASHSFTVPASVAFLTALLSVGVLFGFTAV